MIYAEFNSKATGQYWPDCCLLRRAAVDPLRSFADHSQVIAMRTGVLPRTPVTVGRLPRSATLIGSYSRLIKLLTQDIQNSMV